MTPSAFLEPYWPTAGNRKSLCKSVQQHYILRHTLNDESSVSLSSPKMVKKHNKSPPKKCKKSPKNQTKTQNILRKVYDYCFLTKFYKILKGKNHIYAQLTKSTAGVPILCLHRNLCESIAKKSKRNCEVRI